MRHWHHDVRRLAEPTVGPAEAYDVFARAAETGAFKVVLSG